MKYEASPQVILQTLATKSSNKQLVHRRVLSAFSELRRVVQSVAVDLNSKMVGIDRSVVVEFVDRGEFEFEIRFSGDSLVFQVHTNAFLLPEEHTLRDTDYVKSNPNRAYYGLIHVYNFLSDSFRMRRLNDVGTLMSRFFVNGEGHHFAEGVGPLNLPLSESEVSGEDLQQWLYRLMVTAMDFDLQAAPFQAVQDVSVLALEGIREELRQRTGKRLGFRPEGR
ncbi:MAG: hypothetical protein RL738_1048 [Bacteroidota bacterium]|jgi:hypothetical protein